MAKQRAPGTARGTGHDRPLGAMLPAENGRETLRYVTPAESAETGEAPQTVAMRRARLARGATSTATRQPRRWIATVSGAGRPRLASAAAVSPGYHR